MENNTSVNGGILKLNATLDNNFQTVIKNHLQGVFLGLYVHKRTGMYYRTISTHHSDLLIPRTS